MNDHPHSTSSPRWIRQSNSIAALRTLFDFERLSRAELARHLGLNRSSSGSIVSELVAGALVREVPSTDKPRADQTRAGRPGILLELEPEAAVFLGAEIGVEHITTLQINLTAELVACRIEPFDGQSVPPDKAVEAAIHQAFDGLSPDIAERIEGFGLVAPAQINAGGTAVVAPLLGWENVDLRKLAQRSLPIDVPVMVENDANAFAFGEGFRDQKTKSGVTLCLVIETGVGGGIVIDGKLFRGGNGLAGEVGHWNIRDGVELEEVLGLGHLLEQHRAATKRDDVKLDDFLAHVSDREPKAVEIAETWARDLASAIVTVCRIIDPDRLVLGGSVAALYPLVSARVAHHVRMAQADTFPMPEISVHESAETGAAYGAACILHRRFMSLENQQFIDVSAEHASAE